MPTIANQAITRGDIRLFEQGDWFADLATNTDELLAVGSRVEIVAENLTLSGAIVRGGITNAVGRYQVAGRPEWGNALPAKASAAYRSANAVQRKLVLSDLARDVLGSNWASLVVMPPEAVLGQHYERAGTSGDVVLLGRDALRVLGVPWYVRADGATVFATRPGGDVTTSERILVAYRNDAIGYRVVNCNDVAAFTPGRTFEGEAIGEVVIAIRPENVQLHVWSRAASSSFADALRTVWRRIFPRVELQGMFSYVTVGPSQAGKHDLRSSRSRHLPDVKLADSWLAPGFTAELAAGTRVLVAFADGDPSTPVLVAAEPGSIPETMALAATTTAAVNSLNVDLGDATAPVVIASASLTSWVTAVSTATGAPPPTGYTSFKVKA